MCLFPPSTYSIPPRSPLSRNKNQLFGNDTIDRYPLPYRGKLTKLLCIGKEIFEKLRLTTRGFYVRQAVFKNTPAQLHKTKALPKTPALPSSDTKKAIYPEYAPTKIWPTRHSEFWRWQRVSEWHREYGQVVEITNEKRHILV